MAPGTFEATAFAGAKAAEVARDAMFRKRGAPTDDLEAVYVDSPDGFTGDYTDLEPGETVDVHPLRGPSEPRPPQDIDTMLEKAEMENPALGRMAAMGSQLEADVPDAPEAARRRAEVGNDELAASQARSRVAEEAAGLLEGGSLNRDAKRAAEAGVGTAAAYKGVEAIDREMASRGMYNRDITREEPYDSSRPGVDIDADEREFYYGRPNMDGVSTRMYLDGGPDRGAPLWYEAYSSPRGAEAADAIREAEETMARRVAVVPPRETAGTYRMRASAPPAELVGEGYDGEQEGGDLKETLEDVAEGLGAAALIAGTAGAAAPEVAAYFGAAEAAGEIGTAAAGEAAEAGASAAEESSTAARVAARAKSGLSSVSHIAAQGAVMSGIAAATMGSTSSSLPSYVSNWDPSANPYYQNEAMLSGPAPDQNMFESQYN